MLDALLAEARLRWGLDPADGLAVVPGGAADRDPAGAVAAGAPRPAGRPPGRAAGGAARPASRPPRPGRPRRRSPCCGASTRPTTRSGGSARRRRRPSATSPRPTWRPRSTWRPSRRSWPPPRPGGCPGSRTACARPDGCPWDREQTHESLRNHLLEEAYEVYDALADGATPELAGELGDLWLQVVLHAQLAAEAGVFDLADVQAAIAAQDRPAPPPRLRRRGGPRPRPTSTASGSGSSRRSARPRPPRRGRRTGEPAPAPKSALEGVSRSMPALAASQEMQERAAHLGYDWPSVDGILAKVAEELGELAAAEGPAARAEELGDLLMVVVNLARHHDVEAEAALRAANEKFRRRFGIVERLAAERGVALRDLSFAELDELWDAAKAELARQNGRASVRRAAAAAVAERCAMTIGNRGPVLRPSGRRPDELRPVTMTLGVQKWAEGSCRIRVGDTEVLCAATIEDRVPPHLRGKGSGWVTAEYSMLPRATAERTQREATAGKIGGRTHEIQRLIGRSLRGVVDLARLGERTVTVDCDVLQADGGTRTASITGGYVALAAALITYGMERLLVGQGGRGLGRDPRRRRRCSTSTTPRTGSPRSTSTSWARTPAATSSCRGRPRASPSRATTWTRLLDLAGAGSRRLFAAQAAALATVKR